MSHFRFRCFSSLSLLFLLMFFSLLSRVSYRKCSNHLSSFHDCTMVVPPSFRSSQSTITVKKGERDVVLNCEPRGEKPMTISWARDGAAFDPLSEGHRYEVRHRESSGNGAIGTTTFVDLKIKMVERRDSTLLTCIATNNFGRAEYNINLIVQGEYLLHVSFDFVIATLSYKRYTQREEVNSSGSYRDNSILNLSTMV